MKKLLVLLLLVSCNGEAKDKRKQNIKTESKMGYNQDGYSYVFHKVTHLKSGLSFCYFGSYRKGIKIDCKIFNEVEK